VVNRQGKNRSRLILVDKYLKNKRKRAAEKAGKAIERRQGSRRPLGWLLFKLYNTMQDLCFEVK
jgi:hypothetical protein